MDGDHRSARHREALDVPFGLDDHEMHVERHCGDSLEGTHHRNPDGQIWDKAAIHHVDVNKICSSTFDCGNLVGEVSEVSRKDGGGDPEAHRLTSSEIASPGAI